MTDARDQPAFPLRSYGLQCANDAAHSERIERKYKVMALAATRYGLELSG